MSRAKSIPKSASRSARSASRRRKISTASSSLTNRCASTTPAARGAIRNSLATQAKAFRPCARNGSASEGTSPTTRAARSNRKTTATSRVATKNSPARPSAGIASSISKARNANRSVPAPVIPSRSSGTPARASSPPRWNSLPSGKITGSQVGRKQRRSEDQDSEL